jgi:hypothetical protein
MVGRPHEGGKLQGCVFETRKAPALMTPRNSVRTAMGINSSEAGSERVAVRATHSTVTAAPHTDCRRVASGGMTQR